MRNKKQIIILTIILFIILVIIFAKRFFYNYIPNVTYNIEIENKNRPNTSYILKMNDLGEYFIQGNFDSSISSKKTYEYETKNKGSISAEQINLINDIINELDFKNKKYKIYYSNSAKSDSKEYYTVMYLVEAVNYLYEEKLDIGMCYLKYLNDNKNTKYSKNEFYKGIYNCLLIDDNNYQEFEVEEVELEDGKTYDDIINDVSLHYSNYVNKIYIKDDILYFSINDAQRKILLDYIETKIKLYMDKYNENENNFKIEVNDDYSVGKIYTSSYDFDLFNRLGFMYYSLLYKRLEGNVSLEDWPNIKFLIINDITGNIDTEISNYGSYNLFNK